MCSKDGYHNVSSLDILTQKFLRYQHHRENYLESLQQEIISSGLKLKKKPVILRVSAGFEEKLKLILKKSEKKLVEKLLVESEKSSIRIKKNKKVGKILSKREREFDNEN